MAAEPVEIVRSVAELPAGEDRQDSGGCGGGGGTCGCSGAAPEEAVLDGRTIAHSIRHATILGALGGTAVGSSLVLIAPHDPLPLIAQLEAAQPGAFTIDYLERGPEDWKLRFNRVSA